MAANKTRRAIPGVGSASLTDLPVLHPVTRRMDGPTTTQWLAGLPWWTALLAMVPLLLWPFHVQAASKVTVMTAFGALRKWIPFLFISGFLFNILISMFAMLFGTLAGAARRSALAKCQNLV